MQNDNEEKDPEQQPEFQSIPQHKPIVCPVCGSREIAFITDHHKCVILKAVCQFIIAIILITFALNIKNALEGKYSFLAILILIPFYLIFSMIIYSTESTTHAKAICRDCGKIWLID